MTSEILALIDAELEKLYLARTLLSGESHLTPSRSTRAASALKSAAEIEADSAAESQAGEPAASAPPSPVKRRTVRAGYRRSSAPRKRPEAAERRALDGAVPAGAVAVPPRLLTTPEVKPPAPAPLEGTSTANDGSLESLLRELRGTRPLGSAPPALS